MIRLVADGLDPLELDNWETGIACSELDLGWPATRSVVDDRPGADGTFDDTTHFGARAVSVKLAVFAGTAGTRRSLVDKVAAFCHPGLRPVMEWEDPTGGGLRAITLRADQGSAPMTNAAVTEMSVSWVAPAGVITSAVTRAIEMLPDTAAAGRAYTKTFPMTYPAYTAGATMALNQGSSPTEWLAAIYGPCTGPRIDNLSAGSAISFPGLTIVGGDYLEVDSAARTVRLNGEPSASRYSFLDFTGSSWWQLGVGASIVEFSAASSTPPCSARLSWKDTFL